MCYNKQ